MSGAASTLINHKISTEKYIANMLEGETRMKHIRKKAQSRLGFRVVQLRGS